MRGGRKRRGRRGGAAHILHASLTTRKTACRDTEREKTQPSLSLSLLLGSRILTFQSPRSENNKRTVILVAAIFESWECVSAITDDQIRGRAQVAVSLEYTITRYPREKPQQREGRENTHTRLHRRTCLMHLIELSWCSLMNVIDCGGKISWWFTPLMVS